jgi:NADH-quinone oxidoreductase subunit M
MYKRVIFGDVANEHVAELKDVNGREFAVLAVLAVAVLGMGLLPQAFTSKMHTSVDSLIWQVKQSKLHDVAGHD